MEMYGTGREEADVGLEDGRLRELNWEDTESVGFAAREGATRNTFILLMRGTTFDEITLKLRKETRISYIQGEQISLTGFQSQIYCQKWVWNVV
jgi:hypothetical protein